MRDDFSGKRVVVMGLGLFGGGEGAVRFFSERGASVLVTDLRKREELNETLSKISDLKNVEFRLGRHEIQDFKTADIVVVNPAVTDESPMLNIASESGAFLTTEINLFFERCRGTIVGITGSNGKSTTTALCYHILQGFQVPTYLGGNIGSSLLPDVDKFKPDEVVVLELSSFQLERMRWIRKSPQISAILNLTQNHLDRHKTMESYGDAKAAILDYQNPDDFAVLNPADEYFKFFVKRVKGNLVVFKKRTGRTKTDSKIIVGFLNKKIVVEIHQEKKNKKRFFIALDSLPLDEWGRSWQVTEEFVGHNAMNLAAALACAVSFLLKREIEINEQMLRESLHKAMSEFRPLEHRLEKVAVVRGVEFVNDSIATNPESVIAALNCYPARRTILIAGGYDKGLNYDEMVKKILTNVKALILLKTDGGDKIAEAVLKAKKEVSKEDEIKKSENRDFPSLHYAYGLEEAVLKAMALSESGDTVLLSPACASYGMFSNFEERGRAFKDVVKKLVLQDKTG